MVTFHGAYILSPAKFINLPRYGTLIVFIVDAGNDAEIILNEESSAGTLILTGQIGSTTNLLARVPPKKPSLKVVIELLFAIIVLG
jgi:hypothetical protein